ncbi:MAG TPA: c-type cytochrome [Chitinophagaceae bacterium]|nr:c-type cytochrome [Chitinophagaceae bacterium]
MLQLKKLVKVFLYCSLLALPAAILPSCHQNSDTHLIPRDFQRQVLDTNPPVTPLSPEESIKRIQLPAGFHVQLVASEPMVQEPVAIAWDGDGKMYVAEMNTYMKTANADGELERTSRIMLLQDEDGDGKMDKSTIFADSLLLPRAILCVGKQVLVEETNRQDIWSFTDTDGDGKADEKKIVFKNDVLDSRNVEHQNGGLYWNMDNWIYPSRDNLRYKYVNGVLIADTMVDNMIGQWGMTSDNYGRLFYSEAGPGLPAVQFEQMPAYGSLNFKDQYTEDFTTTWPIIGNVDAQGGREALRADNTLKKFTAGCGQSIYRGDKMPADMQGDYFIPEPVARIIKRGKVTDKNGKIYVADAYSRQDWLASADMNFRPINTYTGPDGCFYIVDMYHGIIQESEWTKPDSYLGKMIAEKELFKNRGMGRIYRIVHDGFEPDKTKPDILKAPAAKLVTYLAHPNGWWRDNAQKEIIVRHDLSVVPALRAMAVGELKLNYNQPQLSRIHALWTLEGLGAIDKTTLYAALKDTDPQVRKAAVWIGEQFIKAGDEKFIDSLGMLQSDASADVLIQLSLSLRSSKLPKAQAIVKSLLVANKNNELMQFSYSAFTETQKRVAEERRLTLSLTPQQRELVNNGATIFKQLCATCHGPDGKGIQIGGKQMPAPPLAGSARVRDEKIIPIQILLYGLKGPVDGKAYPDQMPSMVKQDDKWIASVLSYIRNSPDLGNKSSIVTVDEVKEARANMYHMNDAATIQMLGILKLGRAERINWDKKRN